MIWVIILAGFIVVSVIILKQLIPTVDKSASYDKKLPFSQAERSFLGVLDQAAPSGCRVFAKIRIADLVAVKKGLSNSGRATAQNKINSKHVDFVICNENDLSIFCAIELDDSSHATTNRKSRDRFVDSVLMSANIPLVRISVKKTYNIHDIRQLIESATGTLHTTVKIQREASVTVANEISQVKSSPPAKTTAAEEDKASRLLKKS